MMDVNKLPFHFVDEADTLVMPGDRVVRVGADDDSKEALLTHFADRLDFPNYFGHNWDAFDECLGDLSWLQERRVAILHERLPRLAEQDLSAYLESLAAAAIDEARHGHVFVVAFPKAVEDQVRSRVVLPVRSRWA